MAYPTYPYPAYQPYYSQPMPDQLSQLRQNPLPQPQMIQQSQMVQTLPQNQQNGPMSVSNQGNGIIWVPNYAAANDYLVAANNAVALWDQNGPFVYLKQADSTGKPTIKVYELVERDPNQQSAPQQQIQLPDFDQFVKRDDLRKLVTREELDDIIADRLKKPSRVTSKKEEE